MWRTYDEIAVMNQGNYPTPDSPSPVQQKIDEAPVVEAAAEEDTNAVITPDFCSSTQMFKGEKWGCALEVGHKEEHDFGRPMAQEDTAKAPLFEKMQPVPIAAAQATSPVSARASALRARFDTNKK
jgi:hypothetical protein